MIGEGSNTTLSSTFIWLYYHICCAEIIFYICVRNKIRMQDKPICNSELRCFFIKYFSVFIKLSGNQYFKRNLQKPVF